MSDEKTPDIDEIKERIEIPVDEDVDRLKTDEKAAKPDLVAEFGELGRAFAEAFESAWNSEERKRVEQEVRDGVQSFSKEVDKVIRDAKQTQAGERMASEASELAGKVEASEFGRRALEGLAQGLSWVSLELGKMADQLTPVEKSTQDSEEEIADES